MQDFHDHELTASDLAEAAQRAHSALLALYRQACQDIGSDVSAINGALSLSWSPDQPPEHLSQQMVQRLAQQEEVTAVLQRGHVYCYHCETSGCEHATPDEPGEVFAGYANNGTPIWRELFNEFLALAENRIDRLFDDQPQVLGTIVGRKRLIADQTVAYGRDSLTYRIIAQMIAGYFTIRQQRCAVTVQIVETPDHALHVQTIMANRLAEEMADASQSWSLLFRVNDAIAKLKRSVQRQQVHWQKSRTHAERMQQQEKLYSMLRRLVNSVEQKGRQSKRRTRHAAERSRQKRPVHKAAEDVAAASTDDFYTDTVRQSKIVVGRAGRCHVFNENGRHITSMLLPGDKLEHRRHKKRYVPLPAEEVLTLRPAILNHASDDED